MSLFLTPEGKRRQLSNQTRKAVLESWDHLKKKGALTFSLYTRKVINCEIWEIKGILHIRFYVSLEFSDKLTENAWVAAHS